WLQQQCFIPGRKRLSFNVTISNFTPKPHTPFQWHSVSTAEFKRKQNLLRQEFRSVRGVKANFTDVRISAMEDFVGRGDRRLASVVRRAWELGAGMDSWWESLDRAFGAWAQAIDEAGLTWKYRQVENGEWNIMDGVPVRDSSDPNSSQMRSLDAPLAWDHLDTGIDKAWLKEDLQRALEAATVPDCSFDGCSHCGVCGADFGHNVVIPPPPIPQFAGQFVPNQERVQRVRVWFGKQGEMALVSHLDLVRLFERAARRAALPVAFTGGFHPNPRISPASALSLGATSTGEIVDFELTAAMDLAEFQAKLTAQFPPDIPVYRVEAIAPDAPAANHLLEQAEYFITLTPTQDDDTLAHPVPTQANWANWIAEIQAAETILIEQISKSGKVREINVRDRLFELEWVEPSTSHLPSAIGRSPSAATATTLRYIGSYRNDGTLLRPEHVIQMFEKVAQRSFQLLHSHRSQLILAQHLANSVT
ncbi:MAG TPA: TIGR03936 family radical SAM-associated protein, partial [Crinalium sp.]